MSQLTGDERWEFDNIGYYRQMVHWFYYFARYIDITVSYIDLFTRTLTGILELLCCDLTPVGILKNPNIDIKRYIYKVMSYNT